MRKKPSQSGDLKKILSLELGIHSEYQSVIKENSDAPELNWLYDLKQRRKEMLSSLLDSYCLYGVGQPASSSDKPKINVSAKEVAKYLLDVESKHICELEKRSEEFYCSPDWKQMVTEHLLPLAKQNISELSKNTKI